jgi:hypothetical protein
MTTWALRRNNHRTDPWPEPEPRDPGAPPVPSPTDPPPDPPLPGSGIRPSGTTEAPSHGTAPPRRQAYGWTSVWRGLLSGSEVMAFTSSSGRRAAGSRWKTPSFITPTSFVMSCRMLMSASGSPSTSSRSAL